MNIGRVVNRSVTVLLIALLPFALDCSFSGASNPLPDCRGVSEPEFEGTWDNQPDVPRLTLTLVYMEENCLPNGDFQDDKMGFLTGNGKNTGPDSPWDDIGLTEDVDNIVTDRGEASAFVSIWEIGAGRFDDPLSTIPVTLKRFGNSLEFTINYEYEGQLRMESYRLFKQQ